MLYQWIGLRENPQETIDFRVKHGGFPVNCPLNQSIESFEEMVKYLDNRGEASRYHDWTSGENISRTS